MRLLTTTLHELGHAIPALAFSEKEPVKVFIGSYGEEKESLSFSLGRLRFFFRPRFLDWNLGMCTVPGKDKTFWQDVIILLGGPVASVLVAGVGLWTILQFELGQVLLIFTSAFMLSAVWDLFVNLLPTGVGANGIHHGPVILSDGAQLLALISYRRQPAAYRELYAKFEEKDFQAVVNGVEALIESGKAKPGSYFLGIDAYAAMKEYGGALSIYEAYHKQFPLQDGDYLTIADLYRELGNYSEAIKCYDEYLFKNYADLNGLMGRAICYQQMAEHRIAVREFTVVLDRAPGHAAARRERAYSLLRIHEKEAAGADLAIAVQLEPENPRYFLYYGFYLEAIADYQGAHVAIQKARELGDEFHGIEFKLSELERRIGK